MVRISFYKYTKILKANDLMLVIVPMGPGYTCRWAKGSNRTNYFEESEVTRVFCAIAEAHNSKWDSRAAVLGGRFGGSYKVQSTSEHDHKGCPTLP